MLQQVGLICAILFPILSGTGTIAFFVAKSLIRSYILELVHPVQLRMERVTVEVENLVKGS